MPWKNSQNCSPDHGGRWPWSWARVPVHDHGVKLKWSSIIIFSLFTTASNIIEAATMTTCLQQQYSPCSSPKPWISHPWDIKTYSLTAFNRYYRCLESILERCWKILALALSYNDVVYVSQSQSWSSSHKILSPQVQQQHRESNANFKIWGGVQHTFI